MAETTKIAWAWNPERGTWGSAAGGAKAGARRLGIDVDEYLRHREAGERWCGYCRAWQPAEVFPTGSGQCRASRAARLRERYVPKERRPRPPASEETRAKMSASARLHPGNHLGKRHSAETRAKISATVRESAARGEACHSYRDGKLAERRGERFSQAYKRWRFDVFARDEFTCRRCGDARGGNLHAHHILSFADHPDQRFDLINGVTLCVSCHEAYHRGEWAIEEVMPYG